MYVKYWSKIIYLTNLKLYFFSFLFLQLYNKFLEMSTETCGSFRVEFLHDEEGKLMKGNSLFLNVYNFWSLLRCVFMLDTYENKVVKLEKLIRKNWKATIDLPVIKVLIRRINEGDEAFNPTEYLEADQEQFFKNLQQWKKDFEKIYLEQYLFLRPPIRHKKLYIRPSWVERIG